MLYRQIVAADLQVTNEIHWYSFSFVLKIILWSIIQYKFENGWLYFSVHLHMTPTSRCLFPPILPFEWRFMHLHLGVVARWLVERPLQPDPYFQLSQHNYPIDSLSTVSLIFPNRSTCINTWSSATRGITPFWIFYFILSNMCRQTLHLMLTWNLLRTDGNVTVQSKTRYLHRYQTTVCHVLTNLNNISSWKRISKMLAQSKFCYII